MSGSLLRALLATEALSRWLGVFLAGILFMPSCALAYDKGDFIVRAGYAHLDPSLNSDVATLGEIELGKMGADTVDTALLNLSYFTTNHLAIELILGAPPTFDIYGTSGIIENIPIASIEVIPLVLTAQYYPLDSSYQWQPFVGIGFNYVTSSDVDVDSNLAPFFGADKIELDVEDSFGLVLSLGLDLKLSDKLLLTAQAYYADVRAEGTASIGFGGQEFDVDMFGHTPRAAVLYSLTLGYIF